MCLGLSLALTGCGANETKEAVEEVEEVDTSMDVVCEVYENVLFQIDPIEDAKTFPIMKYNYTLVELSNDEIPELLISKLNTNGIEDILVYSVNLEDEKAVAYEDHLQQGVAGTGGYRGALMYSQEERKLQAREFSAGTGDYSISEIHIVEEALQKEVVEEGNLGKTDASEIPDSYDEIEWNDAMDLTSLYELKGEEISEEDLKTKKADIMEARKSKAVEAGYQVVTGELMSVNSNELLKIQGTSDPNPGVVYPSSFTILKYDAPVEVEAGNGGMSGPDDSRYFKQQSQLLNIENVWIPESSFGKNVTLAFKKEDTWWPSDTSLPLGEPTTSNVVLLQ